MNDTDLAEKKDGGGSAAVVVVVSELEDDDVRRTCKVREVDPAANLVAGFEGKVDPREATQVRRKIDLYLMPAMMGECEIPDASGRAARWGREASGMIALPLPLPFTPSPPLPLTRKRSVLCHTVLYFVQFADKTTLGAAANLGIIADTHMSKTQYNALGSIFYASVPQSFKRKRRGEKTVRNIQPGRQKAKDGRDLWN